MSSDIRAFSPDNPHGVHFWHVSSYTGNNGNCVERGYTPKVQFIRDTKDREGGTLAFNNPAWNDFLAAVKRGEFDLL